MAILTYVRLKLLASLLRLFTWIKTRPQRRRDGLLARQYPVKYETVLIPSRDPGRHIKAFLYTPTSTSTSATSPRPVLVNMHGSGFVCYFHGTDDLFCARAAHEIGIPVLDVDYRKGPETQYPGALHDVEDVLMWVASQKAQFDATRVAVSGFSAGGALALIAASTLRKQLEDRVSIRAVAAIYPVTDLSIEPGEKHAPKAMAGVLSPKILRFFNQCYIPNEKDREDPRASPSRANPSSFPSTVAVMTCEGDNLAPEAIKLADQLDDGSRKVVNKLLKDVAHSFDKGAERGSVGWERRDEAYGLVVKTLREALVE